MGPDPYNTGTFKSWTSQFMGPNTKSGLGTAGKIVGEGAKAALTYSNPWLAAASFVGPAFNIVKGLFGKDKTLTAPQMSDAAIGYLPDTQNIDAGLSENRRAYSSAFDALSRTGGPQTDSNINAALTNTLSANNQLYEGKYNMENQMKMAKGQFKMNIDRTNTLLKEQERQDRMQSQAFLDNSVAAGAQDLSTGLQNLYGLKSGQYSDQFGLATIGRGYGGNTGLDQRFLQGLTEMLGKMVK